MRFLVVHIAVHLSADDSYIFNFELAGLAALNGMVLSGEVYAWIIVFVLPINSALNPILYTFSADNPIKVNIFKIF